MSLKGFHIFFLIASTLLLIGFGLWSLREYRAAHNMVDLAWAVGSLLAAALLLTYGRWFLRKLHGVK